MTFSSTSGRRPAPPSVPSFDVSGASVERTYSFTQSEPLTDRPYATYLPVCEKAVSDRATVPSEDSTFVSKNNSPTGSFPPLYASICSRVAR